MKKTAETFEAKSEIKVDRTKYGVTYNSGKGQNKDYVKALGDKLIYDEFTLNVTFSAKK